MIPQLIQNDVSSTKIRLFLRRGMSVRYLLASPVIDYIEKNHLYQDDGVNMASTTQDKGKEKEKDKQMAVGATPEAG